MTTALRIADWPRYEKADGRKCQEMKWVAVPIKHDGMGFIEIMHGDHALQTIGAWLLILQVAAQCPTRGLLVSDGGRILGPREIAMKVRGDPLHFADAIGRLIAAGWIEEVTDFVSIRTASGQHPDAIRTPSGLQDRTGQDISTPPPSPYTRPTDSPAATAAAPEPVSSAEHSPLRRKTDGIDREAVRTAIANGDPVAIARAFRANAKPDRHDDWLRETDGLQLGVVVIIFAWRRLAKKPIREASGFRAARLDWQAVPQQQRADFKDWAVTEYGIQP